MNVRAGKLIGELLYVNPEYAAQRGSKSIRAGDLITVRTGHAGVTAVIPKQLDGCHCFTMLISSLSETSNPDYYCHWLNSVVAQHYFDVEAWGSAQPNISVPILKAVPIVIPPEGEQTQIVEFIDRETTKIDLLSQEAERAIELLQERRSALISAAVTGKIDVRGLVEADAPAPKMVAA
jgi:type I restriction enzyme S subunit